MSSMTTCYGESSAEGSYLSICIPQSSDSHTTESTEQFQGVAKLLRTIKAHDQKLREGVTYQDFLIFHPVKETDVARIDHYRKRIGKSSRMGYDSTTERLIIKFMPSLKHEYGVSLAHELRDSVRLMGMHRFEFQRCGGARYSHAGSFKEADEAYKPSSRNDPTDWPTIVFEVGYSESIGQLRLDAMWWLAPEFGENIVVLISIAYRTSRRCLTIEKWGRGPGHSRRASLKSATATSNQQQILEKQQEIIVDSYQNTITGAPLILEFHQIFLRPAVSPRESDIQFSANELSEFAEEVWSM